MKNNLYKSKKTLTCLILYFTAGMSFFVEGAFAEDKLHVLTSTSTFVEGAFAEDKLHVLTSTSTLKSLTESIAGDRINLDSIIKGLQNPHFIAPKPSYMLKAGKAQLLIFIGMDLEVGWLPRIIMGARNPKIQQTGSGYLDASLFVTALSVPKGKADRFFGDIHPYGNPHYLLDPLRAVQVSLGIARKLAELDPKNKDYYLENQKSFEQKIKEKMKVWRQRLQDSAVKKLVAYHSSFEYFLSAFQIELVGLIEEKPGIAPSVKHLLSLIKKMKKNQSTCILMSSFYNNKRAKKLQSSIPVHIEVVDIETGGAKRVKDYFSLIEGIIQSIENCGVFAKKLKR